MTIAILQNNPGIERDGTRLDSDHYVDGQWVRFRRGRPKKMGGYRRIADNVNGPVYGTHVWSRQSTNLITLFSGSTIEQVQVNSDFIGATIYDRTPSGWVQNNNLTWQTATLYDSAAGTNKTMLFAHGANNLQNIDDGTATAIYYGDVSGNTPLTSMGANWMVSGGVVAAAPYLIAYGSDGMVQWSDANQPLTSYADTPFGDAGQARVTDKKIIKGLPIRGTGRSPSVLLWSIDSVIRMMYVGGAVVFEFDTVTSQSSVLSSNGIIEYDGLFYWAGLDRFMVYNGAVHEIPNRMNQDWFYDHLNFEQRQKVFALKMPHFGEIWWFYPADGATECNRAVILNVREQTWYDVALERTSGSSAQTVRNPIMADAEVKQTTVMIPLSSITGQFLVGDTVTGATSGATGTIAKVVGNNIYVKNIVGTFHGNPSETINGTNGSAATGTLRNVNLYALWAHEFGWNKIEGDNELSIQSFVETNDFSYITGGTFSNMMQVADYQTRIKYLEPDFNITGTLIVNVVGETAANAPTVTSQDFVLDGTTKRVDMREQRRIIRLRFTSDCLNGTYEMGKIIIDLEPGDQKA